MQSAQANGEAVIIDPDLGGHELVLQNLAGIYGGPDESKAEKAFRAADADGSGFLDFRELCNVIKVLRVDGDRSMVCVGFLSQMDEECRLW